MLKMSPVKRINWIVLPLIGLFWFTCTQKSPMDPTSSLQKDAPLLVDIQAAPTQISIGESQSIIRVRLIDKEGKPLSNEIITFSSTLGTVTDQVLTDASGWAQAVFISGQDIGDAKILAKYSNQTTKMVTVNIVSKLDAMIQICAAYDEILANGVDVTTIKVTLSPDALDSSNVVTLSTTSGEIDPFVQILEGSGTEDVTLVSQASTSDILTAITATWGNYSALVTVKFKGIKFFIESNPLVIPPDGKSKALVTAYVKETTTQIGIKNQEVRFGTTLGSIPSSKETDETGAAIAELTSSTTEGVANIVARYGNILLDTVEVEFLKSQYYIEVETSSNALLGNGQETGTVSITVTDMSAYPVSDVLVQFETTIGEIDSVLFTDDNGQVYATLTSIATPSDQWAVITVTVDDVSKTAQVLFKGVLFDLQADPTYIVADGKSQSTIGVFLKEVTTGIGIPNAPIRLGTNLGAITAQINTDAQGFAQVQLTSSLTQGLAKILGEYGNTLHDSVFVQFGSMAPNQLTQIQSSASSILANGIDQSSITAKVLDENDNPVSKVIVSFQSNVGKIESQALTNDYGLATAVFTSYASQWDSTATVSAMVDTQLVSTEIQCLGVQMNLSATPGTILADGKSTSKIKAILKETTRKIAIPGATVYFGTDLGTITYQQQSNAQGVAEVELTSGTETGTANVEARYGQVIEKSIQVIFQESTPSYIALSATPTYIPADNQSQAIIKAIVSDANWNPVADGTVVQFVIVEGTGTIGAQQITQNGIATTSLTSGSYPDTAKIVARVESLVSDTVSVVYTIGTVEHVVITANPNTLPADGVTKSVIQATVTDGLGNPVENVSVNFSATIGEIGVNARTDAYGIAKVEYSSTVIGLSIISAQVITSDETVVTGSTSVEVLPGSPFYVIVTYNPLFVYVRECGKHQTLSVYADVRDEKNNPVADGTFVKFSIIASPGFGDSLGTVEPVPTVGGISQVSYTSGTRSGSARIKAQITDGDGNPLIPEVAGTSTEIVIYSGPPYIENIYDPLSTHLTVTSERLNIWTWLDTTQVSVLIGDKYNNPVQKGTAVYLTTSGGVVTTTAYTDTNGIATILLEGGNPLPTINRFYTYVGLTDPNTNEQIGDHYENPRIPDMEYDIELGSGRVLNSMGDYGENDGISRILAWTEGVDSAGQSVKTWAECQVIMSKTINHFEQTTYGDSIWPGEYVRVRIELWDSNGNPVVSESLLSTKVEPNNAKAELSWEEQKTADPGQCYYNLFVYNIIDPTNEKDLPGWMRVMIKIESVNGTGYIYSDPIYLAKY